MQDIVIIIFLPLCIFVSDILSRFDIGLPDPSCGKYQEQCCNFDCTTALSLHPPLKRTQFKPNRIASKHLLVCKTSTSLKGEGTPPSRGQLKGTSFALFSDLFFLPFPPAASCSFDLLWPELLLFSKCCSQPPRQQAALYHSCSG